MVILAAVKQGKLSVAAAGRAGHEGFEFGGAQSSGASVALWEGAVAIRGSEAALGLPAEQREKMVHWLFVERIGYKEANERGVREFGVAGSETSVGRFYRRIEKKRAVNDLKDVVEAAEEVNATPGTLKELRASAMKMTGARMLEKAMTNGDVKELAALGHVLTRCEEREIQRGRLALARKKFEFRAAKEALKHAPLLNKMSESKQAQADREIVEAREAMFDDDPEGLYYEDESEIAENNENSEEKSG